MTEECRECNKDIQNQCFIENVHPRDNSYNKIRLFICKECLPRLTEVDKDVCEKCQLVITPYMLNDTSKIHWICKNCEEKDSKDILINKNENIVQKELSEEIKNITFEINDEDLHGKKTIDDLDKKDATSNHSKEYEGPTGDDLHGKKDYTKCMNCKEDLHKIKYFTETKNGKTILNVCEKCFPEYDFKGICKACKVVLATYLEEKEKVEEWTCKECKEVEKLYLKDVEEEIETTFPIPSLEIALKYNPSEEEEIYVENIVNTLRGVLEDEKIKLEKLIEKKEIELKGIKSYLDTTILQIEQHDLLLENLGVGKVQREFISKHTKKIYKMANIKTKK